MVRTSRKTSTSQIVTVLVVVWLWARHGNRPRSWTLLGIGSSVFRKIIQILPLSRSIRLSMWTLKAREEF